MNKNITIKEAIYTGKIERIQRLYRCNECNYVHDTPFEAIKCHQSHKGEESLSIIYWNELNNKDRNTLRKEYNQDDFLYNSFPSVCDYAYEIRKIFPKED